MTLHLKRAPALLLAAALAAGCASKSDVRATSSSGEGFASQRSEIERLEKKIAAARESDNPMLKSRAGGSPAPAAPAATEAAADAATLSNCEGVCRAAQEICTCHRRICELAAEINDAPSGKSCQKAQKDCEEASDHCASCR